MKMKKTDSDTIPLRNFAAGMLRDCLEDFGLSQKALAEAIRVPAQRINDVLGERRQITPDMALRLGRFFGNRPEYWLALQDEWLLRKAMEDGGEEIAGIEPLVAG